MPSITVDVSAVNMFMQMGLIQTAILYLKVVGFGLSIVAPILIYKVLAKKLKVK